MALSFRYIISLSKCVQLDVNQEIESEVKDDEVNPCLKDPLPDEMRAVIINRIRSDVVISLIILLLFFALHCTSVFTAAQPFLQVRFDFEYIICYFLSRRDHPFVALPKGTMVLVLIP